MSTTPCYLRSHANGRTYPRGITKNTNWPMYRESLRDRSQDKTFYVEKIEVRQETQNQVSQIDSPIQQQTKRWRDFILSKYVKCENTKGLSVAATVPTDVHYSKREAIHRYHLVAPQFKKKNKF
ncbi:hypothetical protein PoB_003012800 [Plakobranchus ocellatus]|uniref:Uncharacterized protein n=1 Tax=Plakobranchus ocellatus TaxID=259542 RepID=A0AAV4A8P8_9GAST|nr:hypothetical protein PoB_003012800 [Plakobranchus ocellatus]